MKTFAELQDWLNQRRITEVECLVPDLSGVARGKILPREKFYLDRGMRLPEGVLAMTVTGEMPDDGAFYQHISPIDRDMHLRPDATTVRIVPWASDPTAMVIHDCHYRDGKLVPIAPRSVLRHVCELYAQEGLTPIVAPELEFYLVARNLDPNSPLLPPIGRSGRAETSRQVYSIDAVNEFDPLFEDIYEYCESMELTVDTLIHEFGAGQMEINFLHSTPLALADEVFLFKRTVREAAQRHDMYATFMAKPIEDEPGSAMHIHQNLNDAAGKNIFSDDKGEPTAAYYHFIGGLQRYMPAAVALVAPYVNSYRRMVRDTSAPINIEWAHDNRTVGFRAPLTTPETRRIENRIIGADANPYLAMATTLACGYLGIKNRIKPKDELIGDAYENDFALPRSLGDALNDLKQEKDLHQVLGEPFITVFTEIKELEFEHFMKVISPWERKHLLLHV